MGTTFSSLSVTFHHFYSKLRVLQVVISARYNILMGHMMGDDSTVHHIDNRLDFSYIPAVSIPKGMDVYMNRFQLGSKPHLNTSYAGSIWFLFHNHRRDIFLRVQVYPMQIQGNFQPAYITSCYGSNQI